MPGILSKRVIYPKAEMLLCSACSCSVVETYTKLEWEDYGIENDLKPDIALEDVRLPAPGQRSAGC